MKTFEMKNKSEGNWVI